MKNMMSSNYSEILSEFNSIPLPRRNAISYLVTEPDMKWSVYWSDEEPDPTKPGDELSEFEVMSLTVYCNNLFKSYESEILKAEISLDLNDLKKALPLAIDHLYEHSNYAEN